MRVLVTGGAGFIGSNLVGELIQQGYEITVLDNLTSGNISNLKAYSSIRFVQGDIRDERSVNSAMADARIVFHLAASVGNKRSIDNPAEDAEINVLGTLRVLEAARKAGVIKIVASSSAAIFGELKSLPIGENHPTEPDSPYGCSKLCMEKECLSFHKLYSIEVVCLRYFNVYGPNQRYDEYGNVIPKFVFRILGGEPIIIYGNGEQTRDFVHVRDVVHANISAAQAKGISGYFNIGSGGRISINRLTELLKEIGADIPTIIMAPARQGDVLHSLADITAARSSLHYEPRVDIKEGLREYLAWAKKEVGYGSM